MKIRSFKTTEFIVSDVCYLYQDKQGHPLSVCASLLTIVLCDCVLVCCSSCANITALFYLCGLSNLSHALCSLKFKTLPVLCNPVHVWLFS